MRTEAERILFAFGLGLAVVLGFGVVAELFAITLGPVR